MEAQNPPYFEQQHHKLDAQLQAHLLFIVGADFKRAWNRLQRWHRALLRHIQIENTQLLPHIPDNARWAARMYLLEHDRIKELAQAYMERVQAVAANPPRARMATRSTVLALLDAAHALRHLIEHHHEREHIALAHELPLAVQAAAWEH